MNIRIRRGLKIGIASLLLLLSSHKLLQTWAHAREQDHTNDPSARKRPKVVANMAPGGMDNFYRMLNLTEDQRPRIEAIMRAAQDRLSLVRSDAVLSQEAKMAKIKAIMKETLQKMHSVLRPDQQQMLDQMSKMQIHA